MQQTNFHDYQVMRMSDMPEIHTKIIVSDNSPTGMGELGVPDGRTGDRQRDVPADRQAAAAAADVGGPRQEGAGLTSGRGTRSRKAWGHLRAFQASACRRAATQAVTI